jgi:hypothetical protein
MKEDGFGKVMAVLLGSVILQSLQGLIKICANTENETWDHINDIVETCLRHWNPYIMHLKAKKSIIRHITRDIDGNFIF